MKNRTRLLAGLLSLLLLFTSMPSAALAGETGTFVPTKKAKDGTLVGDVNKNNTVDATDRMILARYLAGWEGYEERIQSMDAADIDRDGDVNAKDRMLLARFLAGWEGYEEYFTGYLVTFDGNSFDVENLPEPQTVKPGECAAEPAAPTKPIHVFTGWYTDEECTAKFDFSTPVTDNLTLYAGWECEIYSKDLDEAHVREEEFEIDGKTGIFTFADNQLVVVVEDGITREALETTLSAYNGVIVGQIPDVGYYQVEFPEARNGADLQTFAEELTACAGIEEAFINLVMDYEPQYDYNPDDPFMMGVDEEWAAENTNTWHLQVTKTRDAWDIVKKLNAGATIRMGVLDEGIAFHDDIDILEITDYANNEGFDPVDYEHGTHVAGIMGAIHDNGKGVAGVAIGAEIIAICSERDRWWPNNWFRRATKLSKLIDKDCKVINMSLGIKIEYKDDQGNIKTLTKDEYENTFAKTENAARHAEDLLQRQIDQGKEFLIVTAAGNNGRYEYDDTTHTNFLCNIQKQEIKNRIIVVGNANHGNVDNGVYTSFSRYDSSSYRNGRVDVMAPGTEVMSTVPTDINKSGLKKLTGTSMAAPFVAGLAGLIWEANPSLSPERVKEIICETALIPVSDTANCGMVNCEAAVELAATKYYSVHFDANGGSGKMDAKVIKVVTAADFTFPECGFTPPDSCVFKCWRFNDKDYAPGDTMTVNGSGSGTAYAVWTPDNTGEEPDHGNIVESGECGENLTWARYEDGLLEISGTGDMVDYNSYSTVPWYINKSSIKSLKLPDGLTSIGKNAFYKCSNLEGDLTIPDSVISIGDYAFYNCKGFKDNLTIGNSVESIGTSAFSSCNGFTGDLIIPNSVKSIGGNAFLMCKGFNGSLIIGNSVTTIGHHAFYSCEGFTGNLILPDSLMSIGGWAFYWCNFESYNLPRNLVEIGEGAFYAALSKDAPKVSSLTIPASVKSIGMGAFYTNKLSAYEVESGNTAYCTVNGVLYTIDKKTLMACPVLKSGKTEILSTTEIIADYAFLSCSSLTDLTIPNSVTSIGRMAFSACGLKGNLLIPNSVTSIGSEAFYYCSYLTGSLIIPSSVTSIGDSAFEKCTKITDAYFEGDAPTAVLNSNDNSWGAFDQCAGGFTIYYLEGKSGWTTPEWNGYPCYPTNSIPKS